MAVVEEEEGLADEVALVSLLEDVGGWGCAEEGAELVTDEVWIALVKDEEALGGWDEGTVGVWGGGLVEGVAVEPAITIPPNQIVQRRSRNVLISSLSLFCTIRTVWIEKVFMDERFGRWVDSGLDVDQLTFDHIQGRSSVRPVQGSGGNRRGGPADPGVGGRRNRCRPGGIRAMYPLDGIGRSFHH